MKIKLKNNRKKIINENDIKKIAEDFLFSQPSNGFNFKYAGMRQSEKDKNIISIVFDVFSEDNFIFDGPIIIFYNIDEGKIGFYEDFV